MLKQSSPIVPPLPSDASFLNFSQILQGNFLALFQAGHIHAVVSTAPTSRTGGVGDIYIFDDGKNIYLYIKTSRGWAKSPAFALI